MSGSVGKVIKGRSDGRMADAAQPAGPEGDKYPRGKRRDEGRQNQYREEQSRTFEVGDQILSAEAPRQRNSQAAIFCSMDFFIQSKSVTMTPLGHQESVTLTDCHCRKRQFF